MEKKKETEEFIVEKGIPFPDFRASRIKRKYPKLEVGESFVFEKVVNKKTISRVSCWCFQNNKKGKGKYNYAKTDGVIRVWRVS